MEKQKPKTIGELTLNEVAEMASISCDECIFEKMHCESICMEADVLKQCGTLSQPIPEKS